MPCKGCIRRRGKILTTTRKLVNRFRSSLIRKAQTMAKAPEKKAAPAKAKVGNDWYSVDDTSKIEKAELEEGVTYLALAGGRTVEVQHREGEFFENRGGSSWALRVDGVTHIREQLEGPKPEPRDKRDEHDDRKADDAF